MYFQENYFRTKCFNHNSLLEQNMQLLHKGNTYNTVSSKALGIYLLKYFLFYIIQCCAIWQTTITTGGSHV